MWGCLEQRLGFVTANAATNLKLSVGKVRVVQILLMKTMDITLSKCCSFSKPLFWKVMKRNRAFDTGTDHTHQQPPFITGLQIFIIQSILEYYGTYPLLHSYRGSALSNCKDLHSNYISITTKRCFLYLLYFLQLFFKV